MIEYKFEHCLFESIEKITAYYVEHGYKLIHIVDGHDFLLIFEKADKNEQSI
jgi:hypothetical protein